jgi:RWD domain
MDLDQSSPIARVINKLNDFAEDVSQNNLEDQDLSWAQQLADELLALSSIYDEEAIGLLSLQGAHPAGNGQAGRSRSSSPTQLESQDHDLQRAIASSWSPGMRLRLSFRTELETHSRDTLDLRIAVTLPERYPANAHPPQLQLLNRFVGSHMVDHVVFGKVLRCFLHDDDVLSEHGRTVGLKWNPGESVLFEALDWLKELVGSWYEEKEKEHHAKTVGQEAEREAKASHANNGHVTEFDASEGTSRMRTAVTSVGDLQALAERLQLVSAPPITERKSVFIGHCCRLEDPSQVSLVNR